jgi:hypothetical protein
MTDMQPAHRYPLAFILIRTARWTNMALIDHSIKGEETA